MLNEEIVINMKLAGQRSTRQLTSSVIRRIDASGFAMPTYVDSALRVDHAFTN